MSQTLSCPEVMKLGAIGAPGSLAPDPGQLFSKEETGCGRSESTFEHNPETCIFRGPKPLMGERAISGDQSEG